MTEAKWKWQSRFLSESVSFYLYEKKQWVTIVSSDLDIDKTASVSIQNKPNLPECKLYSWACHLPSSWQWWLPSQTRTSGEKLLFHGYEMNPGMKGEINRLCSKNFFNAVHSLVNIGRRQKDNMEKVLQYHISSYTFTLSKNATPLPTTLLTFICEKVAKYPP